MNCAVCGKEIPKSLYLSDILCSHECFEKAFWLKIIQEKDRHVIVRGISYHIASENSNSLMRGFRGHKFNLRNLFTKEETSTTNLWCQGVIPEEFRDDLPDTHEFI